MCTALGRNRLGVNHMESCLMIKLKTSYIIFVVSSSAPLRCSALIPLLSADFSFLRHVNLKHQFFHGKIFDVIVLFKVLFKVFNMFIIVSRCPSHLFLSSSTDLRKTVQMCWQCVSSMLRCLRLNFSGA